jgi:hypothetical protein
MSPTAIGCLFAIGAALLAFWTLTRFPTLGLRTVRQAVVAFAAVLLIEVPMGAGFEVVSRSAGAAAALLIVFLPFLILLFWAAACLLRSLAGLLAPYRR